MSKILRARVISGRFAGQTVRITNVSLDELGRKKAACILPDGTRANIMALELEIIPEVEEKAPEAKRAKTASMPFISGAASSRTLTQTKNMARPREMIRPEVSGQKMSHCELCGQEYNLEARRNRPGKITICEDCADESNES